MEGIHSWLAMRRGRRYRMNFRGYGMTGRIIEDEISTLSWIGFGRAYTSRRGSITVCGNSLIPWSFVINYLYICATTVHSQTYL